MTVYPILKSLLSDLSKRSSRSEQEVRVFIQELSLLIDEALEKDKLVKIAGLGTFKLLWVEARKSVNVQNNQPNIIPGHYKLKFIPEAGLKDYVNMPLSHLSRVDLEDEETQNLPDIEQEANQVELPLKRLASQAENLKSMLTDIQSDVPTKTKILKKQSESPAKGPFFVGPQGQTTLDDSRVGEPIKEAALGSESNNKNSQKLEIKEEELQTVKEMNSITQFEDVNENDEPAWTSKEEILEDLESPVDMPIVAPPVIKEELSTGLEKKVHSIKQAPKNYFLSGDEPQENPKYRTLLVICIIALILACVGVGFWTIDFKNVKQNTQSFFEESPQIVDPIYMDTLEVESPIENQKDSLMEDSMLWESLIHKERTHLLFMDTIVLQKGERLVDVALKYYHSKDYWVYIYEANSNKIPNPDALPEGLVLVVPELPKMLIDTSKMRTHTYALTLKKRYLQLD